MHILLLLWHLFHFFDFPFLWKDSSTSWPHINTSPNEEHDSGTLYNTSAQEVERKVTIHQHTFKTVYSRYTRKDQSHPHSLQTGFSGWGWTGVTGRMDEVDLDKVIRPKKNVTGELTYVPVQRLDPQDYEGPIQGPLDSARSVQNGEGSLRANLGSYPAYLLILINISHWSDDWFMENWHG